MHEISRRGFAATGLVALFASQVEAGGIKPAAGQFGQINKLTAKAGKVAALYAELCAVAGALVAALPNALTYEVLANESDPDTLWTIELWPSAEVHTKSVSTPGVQASISRCRVLTERFENVATFDTRQPIGVRQSSD